MKYKDYYQILGVERTATQDEIRRAYKKLARKYHPDVSKEPQAEERFKEVNEAHEVLKDPEKRAAYDRLGSSWQSGQEFTPPPGWDTGFEFRGGGFGGSESQFSDFFESLFGRGGPFGGVFRDRPGYRGGFSFKGEDHRAKVRITLEEAYQGATKEVRLEVPEVDGQGRVVTRGRTLKFKIPAGVANGQQIRLAGQGTPGTGGGPAGDLLLEVEVAPHPLFHLEGADVHLTLPVTPWEAALGATVTIPTLGGAVEMKIPPGSNSGQKLRLKGRGLPGAPAGNQYVTLQIITPPASNAAAKRLYEEMARVMPFNPRAGLEG